MSDNYRTKIVAHLLDAESRAVEFIHEDGKATQFSMNPVLQCQVLMTFPKAPYAHRSPAVKEILAQWGFGDTHMVHISLRGGMVFIVLSTVIDFSFKSSDWFVKCSMSEKAFVSFVNEVKSSGMAQFVSG
jgi:hypothetical protein